MASTSKRSLAPIIIVAMLIAMLAAVIPFAGDIVFWVQLKRVQEIGADGTRIERYRPRWGDRKGQWHGPYRVYFADSNQLFWQGRYVYGKYEGVFTRRDQQGEIDFQKVFDNGVEVDKRATPPWYDARD